MRMKKTFTLVKIGRSRYVTLSARASASGEKSTIRKAIKRVDNSGIVKVEVRLGQRRKLMRDTAKLIGSMLADPVTEVKQTKAHQLVLMAKEAAESPVTARFRRAAA